MNELESVVTLLRTKPDDGLRSSDSEGVRGPKSLQKAIWIRFPVKATFCYWLSAGIKGVGGMVVVVVGGRGGSSVNAASKQDACDPTLNRRLCGNTSPVEHIQGEHPVELVQVPSSFN